MNTNPDAEIKLYRQMVESNSEKAIAAAENAVTYMQRGWWGSAEIALADAERYRKAADAAAANLYAVENL